MTTSSTSNLAVYITRTSCLLAALLLIGCGNDDSTTTPNSTQNNTSDELLQDADDTTASATSYSELRTPALIDNLSEVEAECKTTPTKQCASRLVEHEAALSLAEYLDEGETSALQWFQRDLLLNEAALQTISDPADFLRGLPVIYEDAEDQLEFRKEIFWELMYNYVCENGAKDSLRYGLQLARDAQLPIITSGDYYTDDIVQDTLEDHAYSSAVTCINLQAGVDFVEQHAKTDPRRYWGATNVIDLGYPEELCEFRQFFSRYALETVYEYDPQAAECFRVSVFSSVSQRLRDARNDPQDFTDNWDFNLIFREMVIGDSIQQHITDRALKLYQAAGPQEHGELALWLLLNTVVFSTGDSATEQQIRYQLKRETSKNLQGDYAKIAAVVLAITAEDDTQLTAAMAQPLTHKNADDFWSDHEDYDQLLFQLAIAQQSAGFVEKLYAWLKPQYPASDGLAEYLNELKFTSLNAIAAGQLDWTELSKHIEENDIVLQDDLFEVAFLHSEQCQKLTTLQRRILPEVMVETAEMNQAYQQEQQLIQQTFIAKTCAGMPENDFVNGLLEWWDAGELGQQLVWAGHARKAYAIALSLPAGHYNRSRVLEKAIYYLPDARQQR